MPASAATPDALRTLYAQTVSIEEACEIVKVSRRTIYNWMEKGKIRWVRQPGGAVRIFTESLVDRGAP